MHLGLTQKNDRKVSLKADQSLLRSNKRVGDQNERNK